MRRALRHLAPLAMLAAGLAAFFAFGLDHYLSFAALRENRAVLMHFVAANMVGAILLYIAVYALLVAISVPGATVLTVAGGFLFGTALGTVLTVVGATIGAVAVFLAARTALGGFLRALAGPALKRLEAGFRTNAFNYLLALRLMPLFPFFLVNIAPAFLGVPLATYVMATLIGIVPGSFVFASVGAGLGSLFDKMRDFSLEGAMTTEIVVALVGLSILPLIPVVYRKLRERRK